MRSSSLARNSRFLIQPNRTILYLSFPILLALIAEPVTGLVDTAFVAQLGTKPLASLTVGTGALSSLFWIFGFFGIATQTEVAQAYGKRDSDGAVKSVSLTLILGLAISLMLCALLIPSASAAASLLGADGEVRTLASEYIRLRLLGAPAVLITIVGFGALRGVQDMKTPLWIALGINICNVLLDYPLIFGWAFLPALGVGGAAIASSLSQWFGACWMLWQLRRKIGFTQAVRLRDSLKLMRVSRDLFIRTGSLTLFTLVATRAATQLGAESGAAHQVIRQFWFFSALVLEAFATTAQSLIGYFVGSGQIVAAKRVALSTTVWSLATSLLLMVLMLLATPLVTKSMVPASAVAVFTGAWLVSALSQPLNALAFITDGIHWGASDYGFLRNAMLMATICGLAALQTVAADFTGIWLATTLWIGIRAFWGVLRVFPGIGNSPFRAGVIAE